MGSETKAGASTSHNRRTHVLTMATVSITNFVTCRAPVAGARAARASNGAAVRAPVAVASTNGVSLGGARQGSLAGRVGARAAASARSARRVALAAAAAETKEAAPTAEVEEPALESDVSATPPILTQPAPDIYPRHISPVWINGEGDRARDATSSRGGTRDGRRYIVFGTHETATSSSACAPTELDVSAPERHPTIRPPYRRPDILLPRRGRKTDFSIPVPFPRNAGWRRLHRPPRPSQGW